jgi:acyl carrier protein
VALEEVVITALARALRLPIGEVRLGSRLEDDLGLDSMGMINVNVAVEEQFGIAVAACEAPEDTIRTVQDLVNFVAEKVNRSAEEGSLS